MIRTYIIENTKNEVIQYFRTLKDAKSFCVKYYDQEYSILVIHGDYFGEGFHKYRLTLNTSKLVFNKEVLS